MNALWSAYRMATPALGVLAPAAGWFAPPRERALWSERLGRVSVPGGVHAWVHAASMGEALAAEALVAELTPVQPHAKLQVTASTRAGRTRLRQFAPGATLAPIDSPQAIRRFLAGVRPERVFLLETELWFHWLMAARAARIPVAVVSARLSARSLSGYRRFGEPLQDLVQGLAAVLCQTELDAERWLSLGAAPRDTVVVGNLKNDVLPAPPADRAAARSALGLDPGRPVLVLGSLRPGEAAALARAWASLAVAQRERWQVVAVPRHPKASAELRDEARRSGQVVIPHGTPTAGAWRWDDRLGVLIGWYQVADVAFVGGSLGRYGGHNPLEAAACGAAVIVGPHHQSQGAAMRALQDRDAVWVAGSEVQLVLALDTLLGNDAARAARASSGLAVAAGARGAAHRAVRELAARDLWPLS